MQSIQFKTNRFDLSKENKNPINPIYGESLLLWLKSQISEEYDLPEPEPEDWGWYTFINWDGRSYMLGSSANQTGEGETEWVLQIEKQRSLKEKLLGKNKMLKDDKCFAFFLDIISTQPDFNEVLID